MTGFGSWKHTSKLFSFPSCPQDVSDTARIYLLYTRFVAVAGQLAPLFWEFVRRHGARAHPRELRALLFKCHTAREHEPAYRTTYSTGDYLLRYHK